MALNSRQLKFAEGVIAGKPASQAYRDAGYKVTTPGSADVCASQLLRNPKVAAFIQSVEDKAAAKLELSAGWVLSRLKENVERAMTTAPVLNNEGEPTGEYRYEGAVANRALELLGKHLGMFKDKLEMSGPGGTPIHFYMPSNGRDDAPADEAEDDPPPAGAADSVPQ